MSTALQKLLAFHYQILSIQLAEKDKQIILTRTAAKQRSTLA